MNPKKKKDGSNAEFAPQDSAGYLEFGVSVGMSRTGRVLAVGSPRASPGAALIYKYQP